MVVTFTLVLCVVIRTAKCKICVMEREKTGVPITVPGPCPEVAANEEYQECCLCWARQKKTRLLQLSCSGTHVG